MSDKSAIEWTDASWNPIVGCSIVSPGCTNCYAMKTAGGRTKHTAKYEGLTKPSKAGPVWTSEVRFWERALLDPLKWREPRRIFVNSMGDLFHEDVPDEWIDKCFAVMALAPQHTFQVLTKRADRMRAYLTAKPEENVGWLPGSGPLWRVSDQLRGSVGNKLIDEEWRLPDEIWSMIDDGIDGSIWPLNNVWLGVSCEDQARADERIPLLLDTPAAMRWISAEPLVGSIDLTAVHRTDAKGFVHRADQDLDWVVAGGESGPRARPMHPDWARSLRDQCVAAGVPFLFKQWGAWSPIAFDDLASEEQESEELSGKIDGFDDQPMRRTGKKASGRALDGRTWDQYPPA